MPITVPSRPTNGAVEPTVASTPRPRLRLCTSRCAWRSSARATDSTATSLSLPGAMPERREARADDAAQVADVLARGSSPAAGLRSPLARMAPIFAAKLRDSLRDCVKTTSRSAITTSEATRHDAQHDDDEPGEQAHVVPEISRE